MTAAALLVVLGAALVMEMAGMSMALGAFLAGVLLSESNFRHQLEADIEPFRGLLMGLFFMSVGMLIDGKLVVAHAGLLAACAVGLVLLKAVVVFGLFRLTGSPNRGAFEAAGVLTSAGEFSFVVFPLAASNGLMQPAQADLMSALAALTMLAGPIVAKLVAFVTDHQKAPEVDREPEEIPEEAKNSILVIGFSRFAQIALQVLLAEQVDVTVIDNSVARIRTAGRFGFKVYYGDGTRLDVLRAAAPGRPASSPFASIRTPRAQSSNWPRPIFRWRGCMRAPSIASMRSSSSKKAPIIKYAKPSNPRWSSVARRSMS